MQKAFFYDQLNYLPNRISVMGIPYLFSFIEKDNGPKANSDIKLTDRELEIPGLLVKEISCKMIADKCILSIPTVNTHINHIYEKRRLNFEGAAMVMALEKKILKCGFAPIFPEPESHKPKGWYSTHNSPFSH